MDKAILTALYEEHLKRDFPPDELKPLARMIDLWEQGVYQIHQQQAGERPDAYALFFTGDASLTLLDYYAVHPEARGRGVGSAFLQGLIERLDGPLLVELEAPEADPADLLRLRRIAFYEALGFRDTGIRGRLFGVPFHYYLHGNEKAVSLERLTALYEKMIPAQDVGGAFELWTIE